MLIRIGSERSERIDLGLAGILSGVAGALNAVGFLVAGSFTANMTGNVSLFSETLAMGDFSVALSFVGLIGAFVLGAALAAFAIQIGVRRRLRSVYAWAIAAEGLVLFPLGILFLLHPKTATEAHLVAVLSFVLGLQNAATTLISSARIRTTHVSGMVTDLGIGLAAWAAGGDGRRNAAPGLKLHGLTLAAFAAGGVAGALLFGLIGAWLFHLAAAILLALAVPQILRARAG